MAFKDYKTPILLGGYHYITSEFGKNREYVVNGKLYRDKHKGIDVIGKTTTANPKGVDDIVAFADGEVISAGNSSSMGIYVKIKHDSKLISRYMHMGKGSLRVKSGDKVKRGQILGTIGNPTTGQSTGPHLHFDISLNGQYVDPDPYLFKDTETPPEITKITQLSSTKVQIEGKTNGGNLYQSHTVCYYKWYMNNEESVESYDDTIIGENNFTLIITKPREATGIAVLPVQIKLHNDSLVGEIKTQELYSSYPCVQISDKNKEIINAVPHIYIGGEWKEVIPTVRTNHNWYELYNTDKERVK